MVVCLTIKFIDMKRKSYARDHVTVRLTFEEFSMITSAINFDIAETRRMQENVNSVFGREYYFHRLKVLTSLRDIFPIKVD